MTARFILALTCALGLMATPAASQVATAAPVVAEEVPFITTPDSVTLAMLQLAQVGARDHVIDLGSGDGRIVITAARRFGASGLGVEIRVKRRTKRGEAGEIAISFGSLEELNGLLDKLGAGET